MTKRQNRSTKERRKRDRRVEGEIRALIDRRDVNSFIEKTIQRATLTGSTASSGDKHAVTYMTHYCKEKCTVSPPRLSTHLNAHPSPLTAPTSLSTCSHFSLTFFFFIALPTFLSPSLLALIPLL